MERHRGRSCVFALLNLTRLLLLPHGRHNTPAADGVTLNNREDYSVRREAHVNGGGGGDAEVVLQPWATDAVLPPPITPLWSLPSDTSEKNRITYHL